MKTVKIVRTNGTQAIIRVPVALLIEKLGNQRANNLIYANDDTIINPCSDNWAGANVYSNVPGITDKYNQSKKTIKLLISGHHQGEYKSTIDYLSK